MPRFGKRERLAFLLLAALAAVAVYKGAVALEWIQLGDEPGEGARGERFFAVAAFLALFVGAVYCAVAVRAGSYVWPDPLIPVAAAAFVATSFYGFDPYYLPSRTRFSETGSVGTAWVFGLLGAALVLAAIIRIRPRLGLFATAPLLVICLGTFVAEGIGH
jgi:hypothetical protein